jgi:type IV pilus assembly protein PilM
MEIPFQRPISKLLAMARFPVRYPAAAIEVGASEVLAVRVRSDRSGRRLAGYGVSPYRSAGPPSVLLAGKSVVNDDLKSAVKESTQSAGIKPGRVSLIVPDSLARVWLLQVPELPRGQNGILEMIRWKIRKSVPFRIEDAQITWQILSRPSGKEPGLVLVGLIPKPLVHQYESALASAGLKVGLLDLASFNLFNAYRDVIDGGGRDGEDFGVLNATETYFTLMLFRKSEMIFYRCKTHPEGDAGAPEERLRTLKRELATSLSYYVEKLKGTTLSRTFARIADPALADSGEVLGSLGFGAMEPILTEKIARLPEDLDPQTALNLAPALAAAAGSRA